MDLPEGIAPNSDEALALQELQNEGKASEEKPEVPPEPSKDEPKVEIEPKGDVKDEPKHRTPTMVEAWKLKVAEDQKEKILQEKAGLEEKLEAIEKASKQQSDTKEQRKEIADDIETLIAEAEASGADGEFLRKFANTLLNKAKPSEDLLKTIEKYKETEELSAQLNEYSDEFNTEVLPLVKEYNLSDSALLELKESLKGYAFSETYAKVPLKEIFAIKQSEFDLHAPKRSSEGKGVKIRNNDIVDIENLDEDSFKKLSDEQILSLSESKSTSNWQRR